ncbi:MAG: DCC1-like thiol-disulfide oxidoreductase family protein [Candidatus Binatia bacterium]
MSLKNGWTGGQYSLFRVLFGTYLFVHFAQLLPWGTELFSNQGVLADGSMSPLLGLFPNILALGDAPEVVTALLVIACGLSLLFMVGAYDRSAAIGLWYIWACLLGRNPLIANPGLPYIGWMLLAHACLPTAPYGSWAARGRPDPAGQWQMPPAIYAVAWMLMAVGYTYSGVSKLTSPSWIDGTALMQVLQNPLARPGIVREVFLSLPEPLLRGMSWGALALECAFAPLVLWPWLRPWLWGGMLCMHVALMGVIDFADLSLGMVMLHLFTFNPAWVCPRPAPTVDLVFYDGNCGLCHRTVRFLLAEDRPGETFQFAPLDSDTFRCAIPESERATLPDSIIVCPAAGGVLTRSAAVVYLLQRLGGLWRVGGELLRFVPLAIRDLVYDGIASNRYRLFRTPTEACPLVPGNLRTRFRM